MIQSLRALGGREVSFSPNRLVGACCPACGRQGGGADALNRISYAMAESGLPSRAESNHSRVITIPHQPPLLSSPFIYLPFFTVSKRRNNHEILERIRLLGGAFIFLHEADTLAPKLEVNRAYETKNSCSMKHLCI